MLALETLQAPVLPAQQTALSSCCEISFLGMKTPKPSGLLTKCGMEEWKREVGGGASHGTRQKSRSEARLWSLFTALEEPGATHLRQATGTGHQWDREEVEALRGRLICSTTGWSLCPSVPSLAAPKSQLCLQWGRK